MLPAAVGFAVTKIVNVFAVCALTWTARLVVASRGRDFVFLWPCFGDVRQTSGAMEVSTRQRDDECTIASREAVAVTANAYEAASALAVGQHFADGGGEIVDARARDNDGVAMAMASSVMRRNFPRSFSRKSTWKCLRSICSSLASMMLSIVRRGGI